MKACSLALGLVSLLTGSTASAADAPRPNIILIFSDDYGIPGVGSYGSNYKTPNLDALAAGGVRFEHCFSMPLCGPSRAVTLSGRYPFRTGVLSNGHGNAYKPDDSPSIAKTLKQAGYATAVAGKWRQLTHFETVDDSRKWGFDEFLIWGPGDGSEERYWNPNYNLNGKRLGDAGDGKYGPDVLHQFIVDFMKQHRDGPFFVYYPTPLVHGPILRTPDSASKDDKETHYADNIAYLDKLVGKLVSAVDELGLRKNTVIVFTGDNGSVGSDAHLTMKDGRRLDGQKGSLKEGGSRVPLIVNWQGVTPSGTVLKDLVDFSDFYATFAELAKAPLPAGVKLDGRSFAPQLRGEKGQPRDWAFVQLQDEWYARGQNFKLNQSGELFSMKDAPFKQPLVPSSSESPEAKTARAKLQAALDELNPGGGKTANGVDKAAKKAKKKAKAADPKTAEKKAARKARKAAATSA